MNDSKNEFENLRLLLKLKQHEVPPPGYFSNFSSQVIDGIQADAAARHQAGSSSWLVGLSQIFGSRPGLIGTFATSLCLLLFIGLVFAERPDSSSRDMLTASVSTPAAAPSLVSPVEVPELATSQPGIVASTNPVTSLQPVATLFGQSGQSTLFQPANFSIPGN